MMVIPVVVVVVVGLGGMVRGPLRAVLSCA